MTPPITFFVPGQPAPGGSKRAFVLPGKGGAKPRAVLTDVSGDRGKQWRAVVRLAALDHAPSVPLDAPLALEVTFHLLRPKSHRTSAGQVRANACPYPVTRPDATKLLRALEDACTGILWRDDACIVRQVVRKVYGDRPGASVHVEVLA